MTETTVEWTGRTGPFTLQLTPDVFAPTRTSMAVAEALEIEAGDTVIDVGCGTGVLSFVAARLGAARVYGTDISAAAVAAATRNAGLLGLEGQTEFRSGTLFEPLDGVQADVVIGDVSGIPDEVAEVSGWFPGGFAGGRTGAEVPVAMLESVGSFLKPGGRLYLPTATLQDENRVLEAARRVFGRIESIMEKEFPLPALVARSKALAKLMSDGFMNLRQKGSRILWRLAVWRCVRS